MGAVIAFFLLMNWPLGDRCVELSIPAKEVACPAIPYEPIPPPAQPEKPSDVKRWTKDLT